jgi:oxygen-independent coproporphyrinogen-3 oxidase
VPPALLAKLLAALKRRFGLARGGGIEISMEADPGTFDAERLRAYAALGVDRFSVGVQSFDEVKVKVFKAVFGRVFCAGGRRCI